MSILNADFKWVLNVYFEWGFSMRFLTGDFEYIF